MLEATDNQSNWNSRFFEQGGLFDIFKNWRDWFLLHSKAFPSLDALTSLAGGGAVAPVVSGGGFPVCFVRQQRVMRSQRSGLGWSGNYQLKIFLSGEVPSRPSNWHDFFNALTWIYLPKLKASLNARHFHCIEESDGFPWRPSGTNRNREQDMLTLFDEGGLLVVCADDALWEMIKLRDWQTLFLKCADRLAEEVLFVPVGHALFECALKGHPRLHASCIRIRADARAFRSGSEVVSKDSLAQIDEMASLLLQSRHSVREPDDLFALPIWGIPSWHPRASDPEFIADKSHFR